MFARKPKKDPKQLEREFIENSVKSGAFFKDSIDWYLVRYVRPICDRTWLGITILIALIVSYQISLVFSKAINTDSEFPIIIEAKDQSRYLPRVVDLKARTTQFNTVEESIAKYLLIKYIKNREEYDFNKMNTEDLNKKFNIIKSNSTPLEFGRFRSYISLENKESPIRNFNKNITRTIRIKSFSFRRKINQDFFSKAKNFVDRQIPSKANIEFDVILSSGDKVAYRPYFVEILFEMSEIDNNNLDKDIDFKVKNYKMFAKRRAIVNK